MPKVITIEPQMAFHQTYVACKVHTNIKQFAMSRQRASFHFQNNTIEKISAIFEVMRSSNCYIEYYKAIEVPFLSSFSPSKTEYFLYSSYWVIPSV